ncbi:hypothetical protein L1987_72969 [Smallanthus sonchifolius]|uniref:Uncharacterized protein n=1 Tax=Smallanthus sonchifolius TaxID=185202 RepID=A0ACB9B148_9ASTR|nr:hypothetical protein L1987_72969 [Smallanthus sonchifolius]
MQYLISFSYRRSTIHIHTNPPSTHICIKNLFTDYIKTLTLIDLHKIPHHSTIFIPDQTPTDPFNLTPRAQSLFPNIIGLHVCIIVRLAMIY